jgi:hypothetical protein
VCAYRENGNVNRLGGTSGVGGTWQLTGGSSGSFTAAAAGGSFHAFVAVMNAASSVFSVDNTETTGTATGAVTAGAPAIVGAASTTCNDNEMIILDNYALTAGERTYISNGMRIGWGF